MRRRLLACLALGSLILPRTSFADANSEYVAAVEQQKAKQWADAAQGFARVTALAPNYAPGWKQLATCRFYLGDTEGAEASAAHYLKLQPTDSAFAAWDGQLRQKLKLPPLDLNPAPAATPPPTPVPTPESDLVTAPAPSSEAETVTAATANVAPADQAQTATQVSPAPAEAAGPGAGLRLLGAFSLGLGKFQHGEAVNSATTPANQAYPGQAGLGFGGAAELLWGSSPTWEWELGFYPLKWQETQRSSQTTTVTRSNESTAGALFLPVLVGGGWHIPMGDGFSWLLSAGLGAIPSAHVDVQSQTVQTTASGLLNTTANIGYDYALAPAWRVGLGLEIPLGAKVQAYIGGQALGANFSDTAGSAKVESVDENGTTVFSASNVATPKQPLTLLSASALAGLAFHF